MNIQYFEKTEFINPFDGWRSIGVSLFMTLVGFGVLVGVPVISTAWVNLLGFTEVQVGRVVSMDLGGLTTGSIIAAIFVEKLNRRFIVAAGIVIAVAANIGCLFWTDYNSVFWLRFVSGLGGGIYTSVAVVTLGSNSRPAWAFSLMMFAFAFSQTLEINMLPRLPIEGIYIVFIVCFTITIPFLGWIPPHPLPEEYFSSKKKAQKEISGKSADTEGNIVRNKLLFRSMSLLCLSAVLFSYINIGTYWTYIEIASLNSGIDEEWFIPVLTWVSFGSVLGCLVSVKISNIFGLSKPLLFSLVFMAAIVFVLYKDINYINLFISLLFFNFLWIFIDVYQMATLSVLDHSGVFCSLLPASQGLGQVIGPNIAASFLANGMGYQIIFLMCTVAVFFGFACYLILYLTMRRKVPQL